MTALSAYVMNQPYRTLQFILKMMGLSGKPALFHRHRTVFGPYDRISNVNENKTDSYIYIVCLKVGTYEPCMNERKCVIIAVGINLILIRNYLNHCGVNHTSSATHR